MHVARASMCAIMSSRPVEGTKTVAKWSYQWKSEHTHLVLRKGRLAIFVTVGQILPCAQENPRCNGPASQVEDLCYITIGSHSRLPNKYLCGATISAKPVTILSSSECNRRPISSDIHPIFLVQLGWFYLERFFCSQHRRT